MTDPIVTPSAIYVNYRQAQRPIRFDRRVPRDCQDRIVLDGGDYQKRRAAKWLASRESAA